jgi:hypothetical protein
MLKENAHCAMNEKRNERRKNGEQRECAKIVKDLLKRSESETKLCEPNFPILFHYH